MPASDSISLPELITIIRAEIGRRGGYRAMSREIGLTPAHWNNLARRLKKPGPQTLALLGYELANPPRPPRYRKVRRTKETVS